MIEKRTHQLQDRLAYLEDIFAGRHSQEIGELKSLLSELSESLDGELESHNEAIDRVKEIEGKFAECEHKLAADLTAMEKVRIVRHPQRISLRDILENVYDSYTEIGGQDEYSTDPAMIIARATITRKRGKKSHKQLVMVIGQEKGHGVDYCNGGSVKPWGNAKARHFMGVAEIENIPIHTYIFTPGAYPIEDYPGAAQQIARIIYEMAGLSVPVVAVISEGGSGGAEAIALADIRLMLSMGYYSVISPEGAAAIEGHGKVDEKLITECAENLRISAEDNLRFGYVDRVVEEPDMGARSFHYDFYKDLRQEVIRATDETIISVRSIGFLRKLALRRISKTSADMNQMYLSWNLNDAAREKLVLKRQRKYLALSRYACADRRPVINRVSIALSVAWKCLSSQFVYIFFTRHKKQIETIYDETLSSLAIFKNYFFKLIGIKDNHTLNPEAVKELTTLSKWDEEYSRKGRWAWVSPRAKEDKSVTCPNASIHGCFDIWAPDLYGEFAGVCPTCGHHFPMEYQWFLYNVFDSGSLKEFNQEVEAINPLNFPHLTEALEKAKSDTGLLSSCLTFEASLNGMNLIVAVLAGTFRGGTVGAAEGLKIIEASEMAIKKSYPLIMYVHGTAGIRIQEGTHGVIQMPRLTVAMRRYLEAGGLYMVIYDTNSYAGPVASFLGCSPYQYAIRSSNLGFAGPKVIFQTTGMTVAPNYHSAYKALTRGHIQGVWDRREAKGEIMQLLMTAGGRNLYYR